MKICISTFSKPKCDGPKERKRFLASIRTTRWISISFVFTKIVHFPFQPNKTLQNAFHWQIVLEIAQILSYKIHIARKIDQRRKEKKKDREKNCIKLGKCKLNKSKMLHMHFILCCVSLLDIEHKQKCTQVNDALKWSQSNTLYPVYADSRAIVSFVFYIDWQKSKKNTSGFLVPWNCSS